MKVVGFIMVAISLFVNQTDNNTKSYFKFDQIDYFARELNQDDDLWALIAKSNKTEYEENLITTLIDGTFSFADTVSLKNVEAFGFKKTQLSPDKVKEFRRIFNPRSLEANHVTFCDPVFNDILIFREKNTITGYAKICIACGKITLAGEDIHARIDTSEKELKRIKNLLRN